MMKAKSKADRAAVKQAKATAAAAVTSSLVASALAVLEPADDPPSADVMEAAAVEIETAQVSRAASPAHESGPPSATNGLNPVSSSKHPLSTSAAAAQTRLALLRTKPELMLRFMRLIVPVLVEVYAASVALNVRTRTLTGLLKACWFLESEGLWGVVEVCHSAACSSH